MTDNHTIQLSFDTHELWISLLTSHVKDNIEYRLTFSDGVVRYATYEEIRDHSELSFVAPYILDLVPIEESRLGFYFRKFGFRKFGKYDANHIHFKLENNADTVKAYEKIRQTFASCLVD